MDLGGAPAAEGGTGVKQHLHETDHAGVMDLDARDAAVSRENGQGQTLWTFRASASKAAKRSATPAKVSLTASRCG